MIDDDSYTETYDPITTEIVDDESLSMQDNDLYQSVNNPYQQKADTKPRSSKFQSFIEFPELFDTYEGNESHYYDYPSSTKYPVDSKDDSHRSGNNDPNPQRGKIKIKSLFNQSHSFTENIDRTVKTKYHLRSQPRKDSRLFLPSPPVPDR